MNLKKWFEGIKNKETEKNEFLIKISILNYIPCFQFHKTN